MPIQWLRSGRLRDLVVSMVLMGALWGCTNPFIRRGSIETDQQKETTNNSLVKSSLLCFMNFKVRVPYALNQSGSIVFYVLLANSDLSLAVPICNAMALLFSFGTSAMLGESIDKPLRTDENTQ